MQEHPIQQGREPPPLAEYRAWLRALIARGVNVLVIYTGVHGPRYNDADQIFELVPDLRGKLGVAYFPGANHTFTDLAAQAILRETVTSWFTRTYP